MYIHVNIYIYIYLFVFYLYTDPTDRILSKVSALMILRHQHNIKHNNIFKRLLCQRLPLIHLNIQHPSNHIHLNIYTDPTDRILSTY